MSLTKIQADELARAHVMKPCRVELDGKTYAGTLRHFSHAVVGVHVFVTSADNVVIVCSIKPSPQHEIEVAP